MSSERNKETQEMLKHEIKSLRSRCIDTCTIINNSPQDFPPSNQEEAMQKSLCYIEGLKTEIQNSNTPLIKDDNILTSQFLNEIIEKSDQIDELSAFTKGLICDIDNEINRLKNHITIAQEVKSRPRVHKRDVMPEHIHKAKERFSMMKGELHSLIQSMFPDCYDMVIEFIGRLMAERLNTTTNGYIPITSENYLIVELLQDINIVTANPYNKEEIKLAY